MKTKSNQSQSKIKNQGIQAVMSPIAVLTLAVMVTAGTLSTAEAAGKRRSATAQDTFNTCVQGARSAEAEVLALRERLKSVTFENRGSVCEAFRDVRPRLLAYQKALSETLRKDREIRKQQRGVEEKCVDWLLTVYDEEVKKGEDGKLSDPREQVVTTYQFKADPEAYRHMLKAAKAYAYDKDRAEKLVKYGYYQYMRHSESCIETVPGTPDKGSKAFKKRVDEELPELKKYLVSLQTNLFTACDTDDHDAFNASIQALRNPEVSKLQASLNSWIVDSCTAKELLEPLPKNVLKFPKARREYKWVKVPVEDQSSTANLASQAPVDSSLAEISSKPYCYAPSTEAKALLSSPQYRADAPKVLADSVKSANLASIVILPHVTQMSQYQKVALKSGPLFVRCSYGMKGSSSVPRTLGGTTAVSPESATLAFVAQDTEVNALTVQTQEGKVKLPGIALNSAGVIEFVINASVSDSNGLGGINCRMPVQGADGKALSMADVQGVVAQLLGTDKQNTNFVLNDRCPSFHLRARTGATSQLACDQVLSKDNLGAIQAALAASDGNLGALPACVKRSGDAAVSLLETAKKGNASDSLPTRGIAGAGIAR